MTRTQNTGGGHCRPLDILNPKLLFPSFSRWGGLSGEGRGRGRGGGRLKLMPNILVDNGYAPKTSQCQVKSSSFRKDSPISHRLVSKGAQ